MFIKIIWSLWKNILKYNSYTTHGKTMHLTSFLKNEGYESKHEDIECNVCSTSRPQTSTKWKINNREASKKKKTIGMLQMIDTSVRSFRRLEIELSWAPSLFP